MMLQGLQNDVNHTMNDEKIADTVKICIKDKSS